MTERLIASAIEKYVTSHEGVTDFPITYSQMMDEVDTLRIRVLQQMDKAGILRTPYSNIQQTIEFQQSDFKQLADKTPYVSCPRIFSHDIGELAISFVGSLSNNKQYRIIVGRQIKNAKADKWSKKDPIAHFQDDKIMLYNQSAGKFALRGIFERPRDLEIHGYDPNISNYPLSNGQIDEIIGKTADSYIRTLYRLRPQANQTVDNPAAAQQQ